jgi:hypothetical protein
MAKAHDAKMTKLPTFLSAYATAFFLRSAQRFFMAWPILLRAAADRWRLQPSGLP